MADAPSSGPPTVKDFLKQHVRGIPREKMKKKVLYGFKYKDLKSFLNEILSRHAGADQGELLAQISELELKLKSAQAYKERMEEQASRTAKELAELKAGGGAAPPPPPPPAVDEEALGRLEAEKAALAEELEALRGRVSEQEGQEGAAAQELSGLRDRFGKLEKENEFLDSEMEKLNEANRELEARAAELTARAAEAERLEGELAGAQERAASLESVIEASKDMQKVKAMQEELTRLTKALAAWEAGGSFVAVEGLPDYEEAQTLAGSLLESLSGGSSAVLEAAVSEVQAELAAHREEFAGLLEKMYAFEGGVETAYRLGQIAGTDRARASQLEVLRSLAQGAS